MAYKRTCSQADCDNPVYARGFCRKHYNMMWRKGRVGTIYEKIEQSNMTADEIYELNSIRREIERSKQMYNNVIGLDARVKWRKKITKLEHDLKESESRIERLKQQRAEKRRQKAMKEQRETENQTETME